MIAVKFSEISGFSRFSRRSGHPVTSMELSSCVFDAQDGLCHTATGGSSPQFWLDETNHSLFLCPLCVIVCCATTWSYNILTSFLPHLIPAPPPSTSPLLTPSTPLFYRQYSLKPESPARGLRSSPPACTASLVVGSSRAPWPWPWRWIGSRSNQHTQYM